MDTLPDAFAPAQMGSSAAPSNPGPKGGITGDGTSSKTVKVHDSPKFDLESYIANYTGRTRFSRLFLIGNTSTLLAVDALKAAVAEAKHGKDVARYDKAVGALAEVAPGEKDAALDAAWVQEVQRSVKAQTDRLEQELRGYKNNLIKESIRMGNEDLGNHYYETGDMISASKAYSRMRDYCTTPNHVSSMLFKMINVCVDRGDWMGVQANVHRLRTSHSKPEDLLKNQPKTMAALGLAQMHAKSFRDAAVSFLAVDPLLSDTFNEVITPNDIAVYGGLCALASMDRHELQKQVLENPSFRNFLELEPHIRRAIAFFCNSKFRPCLDILENYRTDYLLDLNLQRHIPALYTAIRTKAIKQYLVPFSRVTLDSMAAIFAPEVVGGEARPTGLTSPFVQELVRLIKDKVLDVRIDLEKGVLASNQTDQRTEVQKKTLDSLSSFNKEAHMRILRAATLRAGLEVQDTDGEKSRQMNPARKGMGGNRRGGVMG